MPGGCFLSWNNIIAFVFCSFFITINSLVFVFAFRQCAGNMMNITNIHDQHDELERRSFTISFYCCIHKKRRQPTTHHHPVHSSAGRSNKEAFFFSSRTSRTHLCYCFNKTYQYQVSFTSKYSDYTLHILYTGVCG